MATAKQTASTPQTLEALFEEHFKQPPEQITALPVSGSDRRYYRLTAGSKSAIGTLNEHVAENNTYFYFTDLLHKHGIRVPEVYATAKDRKAYLQQDLGDVSLFHILQRDGLTPGVKKLYEQSLAQLAKLQWVAGREADFKQCFSTRHFDEDAIMADLLYFKYYFADLQKCPYDRAALMDEMQSMSRELGRIQPSMLMYRDFQSRNIMVHEGKVWFIDYQGAMQGPPAYDVASLLWQAKAALPGAWRDELLNSYVTELNELHVARVEEIYFRKGYAHLVLLRLVQVLGAYGFRGLIEGKPHFLTSIAPALKNLREFLSNNPQLPAQQEFRSLLEKLSSEEMEAKFAAPAFPKDAPLQVRIHSFSYKKGIPADDSGNGGGYVFDCRGLLNPGRFEEYKKLSGLDAPVREFLEQQTKMPDFIAHAQRLVSLNVEDYLARGFEHLSISFGCTGGQHRSVYAAEALAKFLKTQYGLEAEVQHLNRDNWVR